MEQLKELLFQLCSAAGTPGDEQFAAQQAQKHWIHIVQMLR